MGKKDTGLGEAVAAPSRLSPADIQQKEFRVSRFGGYKMRDVDEFLDQITTRSR
jgi:DivIVA domain-containing protein